MLERIPIILVTGFLGSGKTTFINWLLKEAPVKHISVILNEFGDISLESQFISQPAEGIFELANGCMCCVAKSDIPRVVSYILANSPQTELILVEASGLSDPDPVREALQTPPISATTYLDTTVCLVDTEQFLDQRLQHPLVTAQIGDADLVLLSKAQLVPGQVAKEVETALQKLTPQTRVLYFDETLDPALFVPQAESVALPASVRNESEADTSQAHTHSHNHFEQTYQQQWLLPEDAVPYGKLVAFLERLPESILRVKGIVAVVLPDTSRVRLKVQKVGSRIAFEEASDGGKTSNALLLLGTTFDKAAVDAEFKYLEK